MSPPLPKLHVEKSRREDWIKMFLRLVEAPISALNHGLLAPELEKRSRRERHPFASLEALSRICAGVAPWLTSVTDSQEEEADRKRLMILMLHGLNQNFSSDARTRLTFPKVQQSLSEGSMLALAFHRGSNGLWNPLDVETRRHILDDLENTRAIKPWQNNYLLFSAVIEGFLATSGRRYQKGVICYALERFDHWYLGDGVYSDGNSYAADYYNSYVIHPYLLTLLEMDEGTGILVPKKMAIKIKRRAARYAEVLERSISPSGSFPATGRSITYRGGAFHLLSHLALRGELPETLAPAAVRDALGSVIQWTLDAEGTFDGEGFLQPGLHGHQPHLAEDYISAGSVYFCSAIFLPLGLPASDAFWTAPAAPWTALRIHEGGDVMKDKKFNRPTGIWGKVLRELGLRRRLLKVIEPKKYHPHHARR